MRVRVNHKLTLILVSSLNAGDFFYNPFPMANLSLSTILQYHNHSNNSIFQKFN